MGCSSYLRAPDPAAPSQRVFLQFKYGFLRELEYDLGDEVHWEAGEVPPGVDTMADALVPAWEMDDGGRHFLITVVANRLVSLTEVPEAEADKVFDENIDRDSRHAWKI